jgi:cytochrome c oxidase subunit 1
MTRLPLTIWAFFVTLYHWFSFLYCYLQLLLIFDRSFGTSFFLSDIYIAGEVLHYQGGSPVLFEHLFWFRSSRGVYRIVAGLIASSEVNQCS